MCTTAEDRSAVIAFAVGQAKGDVATLLFKHADIVGLYGILNRIPVFAANGLAPKELVEAKKVFWGVCYLPWFAFMSFSDSHHLAGQMLDPFIRGGLLQLMAFGSNVAWPPVAVPERYTGDTSSSILAGIMATGYELQPDILDHLVNIFDRHFKEHLEPQMSFFGQNGSEIWAAAFATYEEAVVADVSALSNDELALQDQRWSDKDRGIFKNLPAKLSTILGNQVANDYPFAPRSPGKVPMFCPNFQRALWKLFKVLSPALSLVSSGSFSIYLRTPSH